MILFPFPLSERAGWALRVKELSVLSDAGRESEETRKTRPETRKDRPEGQTGAEPAERQGVPGPEEAPLPVPGGAGVQQGEGHLRPAGGAGDGEDIH